MSERTLIGEGWTAKVYLEGGRAVKLYAGGTVADVEQEALRQRIARAAGLPVLEVFGVESRGDGVALVMEYAEGGPLMNRQMSPAQRAEALAELIALQVQMHAVNAPELPGLSEKLASNIRRAPDITESERDALLARIERLDDGQRRLCHGDFHPLNIMVVGERTTIIDWVDAAAGAPEADACRSYVLFRCHISRMAGMYLRAYCAASGRAEGDVLAWLPVVAAARLTEGIGNKERELLLRLARGGIHA